jgi:hypothetical protein
MVGGAGADFEGESTLKGVDFGMEPILNGSHCWKAEQKEMAIY